MGTSNSKGRKVLIADDDREVLSFLARRCTQLGLEVHTAANGLQALLAAKRNRPDVLIADVNMPELDGLSVCARLLTPDGKPMEVVVISGGTNSETADRCESFGAYHVRKGPAFWNDIRATLSEILPDLGGGSEPASGLPQPRTMRERPLVLLIDDDPDVAAFLSSRLRKFGLDMLYAPDGAQGFRMACRERPSLIISDCYMDNGDALYLLSRLRQTPATETVPVFIITARPRDQVEMLLNNVLPGVHSAQVQVFEKSFHADDLFAALQKFCAFATDQKSAAAPQQEAAKDNAA
jgi:CheY-like chemotaxis protein